jgi:hypothetical protein
MSEVSSIIEVSPKERYKMATYYVKTMVTFTGYVEADSEAEAEEQGWYYDNLNYDGVYDVEVEEQESEEEDDE